MIAGLGQRRANGAAALAWLWLAAAHGVAFADAVRGEGGPVYVEASACEAVALDAILPLLRIELGTRLRDSPSTDALHIRLDCAEDAALVTASTPAGPVHAQRVDLAGTPFALRPRIVALQLAEMAREHDASRDAAAATPAAAPRATGLEPAQVERAAAPTEPGDGEGTTLDVELELFAQASAFHDDDRWLWGGGLRAEMPLGPLRAGIDLGIAARGDAGELGTDSVLALHAGPHLVYRARLGRTDLRAGAGYAVGYARLSGESEVEHADAAVVSGLWGAPFALLGASYAFTRALRIEARAEAGWVLQSIVGEVARADDVELDGLWTSLQLGASLALQ